jgi:prevent-host-death family protein
MKRIGAAAFKQRCLSMLDRVDPEGVIITKHGRPVARLMPLTVDSKVLIGSLKGRLQINGDLLSTGVRWNVEP